MGNIFNKNISEYNFRGLKKNLNSGVLVVNTPDEDDMVDNKIISPSLKSTYRIEHNGDSISFHKKFEDGKTPKSSNILPIENEECLIINDGDHKHYKKMDHHIIFYFKPEDNIVEDITIPDENNDINEISLYIGSYHLPFTFNKKENKWKNSNIIVPIFLLSDRHDCCINIKLNNRNIKKINMSYINYDIPNTMMNQYKYKKFKCGNIIYYDGIAY